METNTILLIIILYLVSVVLFAQIACCRGRKRKRSLFRLKPRRKQLYMEDFIYDANKFIESLEDDFRVTLSYEAKQVLILPLVEVLRLNETSRGLRGRDVQYDFADWRGSVVTLVETMKSEPARIDRYGREDRSNRLSSLSVIKAYARKFCNIPPFCGEK